MIISLESPLLARAGFFHGFSTSAVDLALDAPGYAERVARFLAGAKIPASSARQLRQVHGASVVRAAREPGERRDPVGAPRGEHDAIGEGDALVSADVAIGVRVADCAPILVGRLDDGAVAAIHAGWRGIVAGVVGAALAELGPGERVAAIGPCIGACCFEVDADVGDRIASASDHPPSIARRDGAKAYVDLRAAARAQLRAAGLADADIDDVPGCTRCDAARRFFSFRRDGARAGRHLAAIAPR